MVLGISFGYHDSAAAIIGEEGIIAFSLEERFSRTKHDHAFPIKAINFCLEEANITINEVEKVVFYEDVLLKLDRILDEKEEIVKDILPYYLNKIDIKEYISKRLKTEKEKVIFLSHHLSHASSSFLSPFDECGVLVIDGVGERETLTIWKKNGCEFKKLYSLSYPHSIGLLYSVFTAFLGFEVNEGEYKVMGLASYGKPIYKDKVKKLFSLEDETFKLDMSYFNFYARDYPFTQKFIELFGEKKDSSEYDLGRTSDQYFADIAASIQAVTEELVAYFLKKSIELTSSNKIVFCGGVALNSVANSKLKEQLDIDLFIPPDPGDGGSALGAALYYQKVVKKSQTSYFLHSPFLGKRYSVYEIKECVEKEFDGEFEYIEDRTSFLKRVASLLYRNCVVGWFWDRFEFGPRALGHRSILANPANPKMKDIVNKKIKFRESFRPFAPSVLSGYEKDFFEVGKIEYGEIESFMLGVVKVKDAKQNKIPAVVHNKTARIQVVFRENNSFYFDLIEEFYQLSGIPMLLNTSFNLKGDPIVSSPADAIRTFSYCYMDYLAIYPYILKNWSQ